MNYQPLTMDEALTATRFHDIRHNNWRRNGATKTWKRQPDKFRIPVKYGMYSYSYITERDFCHLADGCTQPPDKGNKYHLSFTG